jgi:hypothetical protein
MDRRAFVVTLLALPVACVRRGAAAPAEPATPGDVPFVVVDAMPELFAFWSRAQRLPLAEQVARFRREVVVARPSLYAPHVLGLPEAGFDAALDARLATWLPTLGAKAGAMRALDDDFRRDLGAAVARFRRALPSFAWGGTCYLFGSVDAMNGGTREVDGKTALLFGLDAIVGDAASMPLPVLFAHELFHVHHGAVRPPPTGDRCLHDALWAEGLATYASLAIVPGTTDAQALPASHRHDPAHPARDIPERRVVLSEVMPGHVATLGPALLAALDSSDDDAYATFFLGRAPASLGERPVRSGYWFGLEVVRAVARGRSLEELARLSGAPLRAEVGGSLAALVASRVSAPRPP